MSLSVSLEIAQNKGNNRNINDRCGFSSSFKGSILRVYSLGDAYKRNIWLRDAITILNTTLNLNINVSYKKGHRIS